MYFLKVNTHFWCPWTKSAANNYRHSVSQADASRLRRELPIRLAKKGVKYTSRRANQDVSSGSLRQPRQTHLRFLQEVSRSMGADGNSLCGQMTCLPARESPCWCTAEWSEAATVNEAVSSASGIDCQCHGAVAWQSHCTDTCGHTAVLLRTNLWARSHHLS